MADPFVVTWKIETDSADNLGGLRELLRPAASLDSVFTDRVATLKDKQEVVRQEQHRLSDYFERLCVLPGANGSLPAVRLFFERRPEAGRFWKDVMASVLKRTNQFQGQAWVGLDYRVDHEELYTTAAQVPRWFDHLGEGSQAFWKVAATYLLKHFRFTFADLAESSGIPAGTLKSLHRNSYRAIKREHAPDPLWSKWDYGLGCNVYKMEPVVRDEVLCLTAEDPGE